MNDQIKNFCISKVQPLFSESPSLEYIWFGIYSPYEFDINNIYLENSLFESFLITKTEIIKRSTSEMTAFMNIGINNLTRVPWSIGYSTLVRHIDHDYYYFDYQIDSKHGKGFKLENIDNNLTLKELWIS